jgi:hypothetical protein
VDNDELRETYRQLALHHHPDRVRGRIARKRALARARDLKAAARAEAAAAAADEEKGGETSDSETRQDDDDDNDDDDDDDDDDTVDDGGVFFSQLNDAWSVIGDEANRALYDLVIGVCDDTVEERLRIARLKRSDAARTVDLMQEEADATRVEEMECDGLVILEARYGDCNNLSVMGLGYDFDIWASSSENTAKRRAPGAHVDVTVPLQCMVEDSRLLIPPGTSKSWLQGFYDPTPINANAAKKVAAAKNQLFIRYRFLGAVHECTVDDMDEVCIPMEEHVVTEGEREAYAAAAKRSVQRSKQKRRRRRAAVTTVAIGLAGYAAYHHRTALVSLLRDWAMRARAAATDTAVVVANNKPSFQGFGASSAFGAPGAAMYDFVTNAVPTSVASAANSVWQWAAPAVQSSTQMMTSSATSAAAAAAPVAIRGISIAASSPTELSSFASLLLASPAATATAPLPSSASLSPVSSAALGYVVLSLVVGDV